MTTTFILIRHGETRWNRERKLMGITDIPLTVEGKRQAARLAQHLRSYTLDVIFSSPFARTIQTAWAIHRFHKRAPLIIQKDLRERNFGTAEGLVYEEVNARYPELTYADTWKFLYFRPEKGESLFEVQKRAANFLSTLFPKYLGKHIAVVSHGTFLPALACQILSIPLTQSAELRMDNTAFTLLQQSKGQDPMLQIFNYTYHLTDATTV